MEAALALSISAVQGQPLQRLASMGLTQLWARQYGGLGRLGFLKYLTAISVYNRNNVLWSNWERCEDCMWRFLEKYFHLPM